MFNAIDSQIIRNATIGNISEDAHERSVAGQQFQRLLNRAKRLRAFALLRGRSRQLLRLDSGYRGNYCGIQVVTLAVICGTENRSDEFDIDFLPTSEHISQRWINIAVALQRGIALPPIELIKIGDTYYVRDGHHRISVMKALGYEQTEAIITVVS